MGSPANLSLGPQVSTVTSAIETALNSGVSAEGHQADQLQKLTEYLHALQEEKGKIEAFKRELPLCMQLIDEAIKTAKQRVMEDQCSPTASLQTSVVDAQDSDSERSKRTPVLENFMPLKRRWEKVTKSEIDGQEGDGPDSEFQQKVVLGRPAWMGEAQLWTKHSQGIGHEKDSPSRGTRRHVDFGGIDQARSPLTNSRLLLSSKHRQGGAFVPFNRERQLTSPPFSPPHSIEAATPEVAAGLSFSSGGRNASQNGHTIGDSETVGSLDVNTRARDQSSDARMSVDHSGQTRTGVAQPQRKARRCWSPELHRRFVNALQHLGGSQVATPKQIRELMKVDGLTNDEVKSHLQKYRLHTRRPSPSPPSPSAHAHQMVILGWVPPECNTSGVCNHPPPAIVQEHKPLQSTTQPQMQCPPDSKKHLPAVSTSQTSLRGSSPVRRESPHSSSDSYLDEESDEEQEGKSSSSAPKESVSSEDKAEQPLQSAMESKGSTTSLADIDTVTTQHKAVKLQTLRKTRAAA
ncbi:hypothetical protein M758_12G112500 [Ceratodon purpureus]|nr:hypothetical protein M758_12G112500 [Ceratodon purpureus]